jgi:hypothetical protein
VNNILQSATSKLYKIISNHSKEPSTSETRFLGSARRREIDQWLGWLTRPLGRRSRSFRSELDHQFRLLLGNKHALTLSAAALEGTRAETDLGAVDGRSHFVGRATIGSEPDHVVVDTSELPSRTG